MQKNIGVPEFTYKEIASLQGKITTLAEKPVGMGATILLSVRLASIILAETPEKVKALIAQAEANHANKA